MSREIKFRAWDIEKKKMRHIITDLHFALHGLVNCRWMDSWTLDDHTLVNDADCVGGKDRFILMQFTGLKDKNGKDLDWWEGDIFARSSDRRIEGVVIYDLGCFWLDSKRGGRTPLYECVDWSMYKVGNIHQHSNLMEQDNGE